MVEYANSKQKPAIENNKDKKSVQWRWSIENTHTLQQYSENLSSCEFAKTRSNILADRYRHSRHFSARLTLMDLPDYFCT